MVIEEGQVCQSNVEFTGILSKDIPKYWLSVALYLRQGLAEGESLNRIHERLLNRECQLWVAREGEHIIAACVTELPTIGERKVCNVITVGGSRMDEWLDMSLPTIEAWAIHNGCSHMRFPEIRPGWQRVLTDYYVTKINLEKAL